MAAVAIYVAMSGNVYAAGNAVPNILKEYPPSHDISKIMARAESFRVEGQTDSALACYAEITRLVSLSSPESLKRASVDAYLQSGNLMFAAGLFTDAFEAYLTGLKIAESCGNNPKTINFYNNIGNIYCNFVDYEKGLTYYETARSLCGPETDKIVVYNLFANMTGAYCMLGELSQARESYRLAADAVVESDSNCRYMMLYDKGLILELEGKGREAARYFLKACREVNSPFYRCHSYEKIYQVYDRMGDRDSSLYYLHKLHDEAMHHKFPDLMTTSLRGLADWYADTDLDLSRCYLDSLKILRDSLSGCGENVREFYRISNLQNLYEIGKTEKKISDLEAARRLKEQQVRAQRLVLVLTLVSLMVICTLLVVVYIQKRKLHRSYTELFEFSSARMAARVKIPATHGGAAGRREELRTPATLPGASDKEDLALRISEVMDSSGDFMNAEFSLARLAELAGSNQKYVSQAINDIFGMSFTDFVNERRVEQAKRLLMNPDSVRLTLEAVGERVGFGSHSTFIRAFRKFTGLTPSIYRKIALQKANSSVNS